MSKLNWDKFSDKLGGWGRFLQPLFEGEEMWDTYQFLKSLGRRNKTVCPGKDDLWKFLGLVNPDNLKCLLIGMEPYSSVYRNGTLQADGLAFSCSNSPDGKLQPSLVSFLDGVFLEMGYEDVEPCGDLSYLAQQGVILGNRSLTVELQKIGSHVGRWDFFWKFFLEEVMCKYFNGIPVVLMGEDAKKLKKHVFEISNPLLIVSHPSSAARNQIEWETKGVFKTVNKILIENNGPDNQIYWNHKIYQDILDLPF